MKNMKNIKIIIPIIIIIVICSITILIKFKSNNDSNACTIITDSKYITLENDGGSHYNIYYKIDFNTNTVKKYEDHYIGLKGYEYKGKLIYKKRIKNTEIKELKSLLENLITKKDINNDNNYSPFEIKCDKKEKTIYNRNSIKILKEKLSSFDK